MLRLMLGSLVAWDEHEYTVIAARPGEVLLRRIGDNERVWADTTGLADEPTFRLVSGRLIDVDADQSDEQMPDLAPLAEDELAEARRWERHINEVLQGVPDPNDETLAPRPGYEVKNKTDRRQKKCDELTAAGIPITPKTLARKEKRYLELGLHGLIDRRGRRTAAVAPSAAPEVVEGVLAALADSTVGSTVTVRHHIAAARAYVLQRYPGTDIEFPSEATMRRLFAAYDHRGLSRGKATTRGTHGNRPNRGPRPIDATSPGHVVEIDTTPINVMLILPDGTIGRGSLTAGEDVATRSIIGFDVAPGSTKSIDHADLLARVLRPYPVSADAPHGMRMEESTALPSEEMLAMDPRMAGALATPYIVPLMFTTDRGTDYLGTVFRSACRHFGIGIRHAPSKSPTFKGHIERLFRTIETEWMQSLPGYVGNSVVNRGDLDVTTLLTVAEARDSFERWRVLYYQNTPHNELRLAETPGRLYTPNEMFRYLFDAGAGVPVPISESDYIALMPIHRRTIQNRGFQIDYRRYWNDALLAMGEMRAPTKDGFWKVHLDPIDLDRAWVRHPDTGEWIECVSDTYATSTYPFASALRGLRALPEDGRDPQAEWALEQALQQEVGGKSSKAATRKRYLARRQATADRRKADQEPRPGPVSAPEPAVVSEPTYVDDEFRVVSPDERILGD